jgi:hypothetical protein
MKRVIMNPYSDIFLGMESDICLKGRNTSFHTILSL